MHDNGVMIAASRVRGPHDRGSQEVNAHGEKPVTEAFSNACDRRLGDVTWIKSSYSNGQGNCAEFARLPSGDVALRNSRFPEGPALVYTRAEVQAMLQGAKDGEFDHLVI